MIVTMGDTLNGMCLFFLPLLDKNFFSILKNLYNLSIRQKT